MTDHDPATSSTGLGTLPWGNGPDSSASSDTVAGRVESRLRLGPLARLFALSALTAALFWFDQTYTRGFGKSTVVALALLAATLWLALPLAREAAAGALRRLELSYERSSTHVSLWSTTGDSHRFAPQRVSSVAIVEEGNHLDSLEIFLRGQDPDDPSEVARIPLSSSFWTADRDDLDDMLLHLHWQGPWP